MFAATATPREQARTGVRLLVAPPKPRNPRKRRQMRSVDRDNPAASYRVRTGDDSYILDDTITVTRLRDYFTSYFTLSETKADAPEGRPCEHHFALYALGPPSTCERGQGTDDTETPYAPSASAWSATC